MADVHCKSLRHLRMIFICKCINLVLRKLCPNVEGTYWGGDTAQTIVAGSAFRIKDLGAYLYDEVILGPTCSE